MGSEMCIRDRLQGKHPQGQPLEVLLPPSPRHVVLRPLLRRHLRKNKTASRQAAVPSLRDGRFFVLDTSITCGYQEDLLERRRSLRQPGQSWPKATFSFLFLRRHSIFHSIAAKACGAPFCRGYGKRVYTGGPGKVFQRKLFTRAGGSCSQQRGYRTRFHGLKKHLHPGAEAFVPEVFPKCSRGLFPIRTGKPWKDLSLIHISEPTRP